MEIKKFTTGTTPIKAPDATQTNDTHLTAAVTDKGELVLAYMEPSDEGIKCALFILNRFETQKIRTVLRHTEV